MDHHPITRRAAILGAVASTAALAPPVANAVAGEDETILSLAQRINGLLKGQDYYFDRIVVTRDRIMQTVEDEPQFDLQHWLDTADKMTVANYHLAQLTTALRDHFSGTWVARFNERNGEVQIAQSASGAPRAWISFVGVGEVAS